MEGLWLVQEDGGEGERGPVEGWLSQEGWLLQVFFSFFLYCTRFACILSSSFQTLQDKEERVLL
jgi:hypothetical protein